MVFMQCIKVDFFDSIYLCMKGMIVMYNMIDMKKLVNYQKQVGLGFYVYGFIVFECEELVMLKIMDWVGVFQEFDMGCLVMLMVKLIEYIGGVLQEYMGQIMFYLYGLWVMGCEVDYVVFVFILWDLNNVSDIWVVFCVYWLEVV